MRPYKIKHKPMVCYLLAAWQSICPMHSLAAEPAHSSTEAARSSNQSIYTRPSDLVYKGTQTIDFGKLPGGMLSVPGDLVNQGMFYAWSSNPNVTTASISALGSIFNQQGATITTLLPQDIASTLSNPLAGLNLQLSAVKDVVNAGTISSAGSLNVSAGGSIVNSLPGGITGPSPIMQAIGAMNLNSQAGSIANTGLISSVSNNVSINTQLIQNLMLNNANGRLEAIRGQINIGNLRTDTVKTNTFVYGGDLISKELNIFSGTGIASISSEHITGLVNIVAGEAYVTAATPDLNLGSIRLSGDPAFYNTLGNVTINSPLSFAGQNLAIVANGDILTAPGVAEINTASGTGNGGAIVMVAGAEFTATALVPPPAPGEVAPNIPDPNDANIKLSISGPAVSGSGGKIDLVGANPITSFDSSSSAGAGGDVTLVAYAGAASGSGTINLPATVALNTGGTTSNGSVSIIAGANNGTPINIGPIDANGGAATGGMVSITYAQPAMVGTVVDITGGAITAGAFIGSNSPAGNVATGDLSIQSPTGVNISSPSTISLGNIGTSGAKLAVVSRGDILSSATGSSIDTGSLTSAGGSILLLAGANVSWINPQTIHVTGGTPAGGGINLTTGIPIGVLNSSSTTSAGSISIAAIAGSNLTSGTVTLPAALTITANGGGAVLDRGASVRIAAGSQAAPIAIQIGSVQALSAVAHANPSINRITIESGQPGANADITAGGFVPPNGLSVFVSRGNSISTGALSVNGAVSSISIDSGLNIFNFSQTANIFVNGSLSAMGTGGGGGGVFIRTTSNSEFQIGPGAAGTGVNGTIVVDGQAQAGTGGGGTIGIQNWGTGGIRVLDIDAMSARPNAGGGSGGAIRLNATNILGIIQSPGGPVTIPSGTLSVSAIGTGGNAGTIDLSGSTIGITGGNLLLTANSGAVADVPGRIALWASGAASDLTIGNNPGEISISITGQASGLANGRQIIARARDLTVNMSSITASTPAAGGVYDFRAERNLLVNGTINNSGAGGILFGPRIFLTSNSAAPFTIGTGTTINGVTGSVIAHNGSGGFAQNGRVDVINTGSGGITLISGSDVLGTNVLFRSSQLDYRNGTIHGFDIALEPLSSIPLVTIGSPSKGAGYILTQAEINQNTFPTNLLRIGAQGTTNPTNGNIVTAGDIQVTGSTSLSIHSNSSTIFNPGFSFSNAGHTISIGTGILDISVQKDIDTGTITGTTGNMTIRTSVAPGGASGNVTVSGPITTTGTILLRANDDNSNILLGANVSGSTVTLETGFNGNISQTAGLVSGNTVIMTGFGNFGSLNQQINTSAGNLQVVNTGSAFVNNIGALNVLASTLGGVFQVTSSGQLTITGAVLAFQASLNTSVGSNANILLQNNVTGVNPLDFSISLFAGGTGSINRIAGVVTGPIVLLQSVDGNIGADGTPIQTAAGLLSISTGCTGAGFVNNAGATTIVNSSTGTALSLSNNASISVSNVRTDNGAIKITTSSGNVRVLANTLVAANGGNLLLQTTDLAAGNIVIETNARLFAFSPTAGSGNITVVVGPIPGSSSPGSPVPSGNVIVNSTGGGQAIFGANGISAPGPNNVINVNSKSVVFETNGRPYGAIQLDGGVTINATPFRTVVTSLDLTNPVTVAELKSMQTAGFIGGNLIAAGGVATGGTIIITPANLDLFLRSENIPSGVQLTMQDFQAANPIRIVLTNCSSCLQVIINGSHEFAATTGTSNAFLTVYSSAVLPFSIGSTGRLASDGELFVDVSGSARSLGQLSAANNLLFKAFGNIEVSAGNVTGTTINILTATGSNGSIMLGANVQATFVGIAADGTGNITQMGSGILGGTPVFLQSGTGSIGTPGAPILLAGGQARVLGATNAFLRALSAIQIGTSTATSTLSISGNSALTILGALSANSLTLQTLSGSNGLIDLEANLTGTGIASTITIRADGSGEIFQAGGNVISAQSLAMYSGTGNIGTAADNINTAVENITLNTGGVGGVAVRQTGNVTLIGNSTSGRDFNLIGMNGVTVAGNITTLGGPIGIGAAFGGAGVLQIAPGVSLTANDGPFGQPGQITLINNDTTSGQINIGYGVSLRAYSNTPGAAQVFVLIGTIITPTPDPVPEHVIVTASNGGQASFGVHGITAASPSTNIIVDGGNVFLDTGSLTVDRISLGGAVLISATPVPPTAPIATSTPILVAFASTSVSGGFASPTFATPTVMTDVGGTVVQTDKLPERQLPVSQSIPPVAMTTNGPMWDAPIETDRSYAAYEGATTDKAAAEKSAPEKLADTIHDVGGKVMDATAGALGAGTTIGHNLKNDLNPRLSPLSPPRGNSFLDKAISSGRAQSLQSELFEQAAHKAKLPGILGGLAFLAIDAAATAGLCGVAGYDCTGRVVPRIVGDIAGIAASYAAAEGTAALVLGGATLVGGATLAGAPLVLIGAAGLGVAAGIAAGDFAGSKVEQAVGNFMGGTSTSR